MWQTVRCYHKKVSLKLWMRAIIPCLVHIRTPWHVTLKTLNGYLQGWKSLSPSWNGHMCSRLNGIMLAAAAMKLTTLCTLATERHWPIWMSFTVERMESTWVGVRCIVTEIPSYPQSGPLRWRKHKSRGWAYSPGTSCGEVCHLDAWPPWCVPIAPALMQHRVPSNGNICLSEWF